MTFKEFLKTSNLVDKEVLEHIEESETASEDAEEYPIDESENEED